VPSLRPLLHFRAVARPLQIGQDPCDAVAAASLYWPPWLRKLTNVLY
jgi:hypothetical protein